MTGFTDGYTRWIIEDEDVDVEDVDGAGNDDTWQDEEMIDNGGGEEAGHGGVEGARDGGGEGAGHGGGENMDSTLQSSSVQVQSCGTLMFKHCFTRRRVLRELLLERTLSCNNWW